MSAKPAPVSGETPRAQRYHYTRCHDKDDWIAANDYDALYAENERLKNDQEFAKAIVDNKLKDAKEAAESALAEVRDQLSNALSVINHKLKTAESALAAERERGEKKP